jgi:hypothetical protein
MASGSSALVMRKLSMVVIAGVRMPVILPAFYVLVWLTVFVAIDMYATGAQGMVIPWPSLISNLWGIFCLLWVGLFALHVRHFNRGGHDEEE